MWKQNLILFTIFFLFILIANLQARNEYLQNQHPCERGYFEPYTEVNQENINQVRVMSIKIKD